MVLTPPGHRCRVRRAQAAFDLDGRRRFVNQQVDSCGERLLQIEQVAHNRHQNAILVELRVAHRTQKFRQVVDLPPVHNDHVKLVRLDRGQGGR